MSRSNICRVCGSSKLEQDLIGDLNLKEGEPATSFRDLISYYSHVQLNSSTSLPTKVCKFCHSFIHSFISFCDNLNKVEMNFAIASEKMIKEKQVSVKQETSTSLPGDSKVEPAGSQSRGSRGGKMPIQNVLELFAQQLKTPFSNQDTHAHVTVDMAHVSESGEIATSWLSSFSIATWMDIIYKCQHCKEEIKSLNGLLNHLKSVSAVKPKIKCAECDRSYSALNSYINHVTKCHHEHLSFCCVECGKIHYNIAALIKHYEGEHPAIANIYPCIECGYYAQSFTQLKIHILGHKTQEVSDSEDEEPASKVKKIAEGQKNWGSKDDQESHSSSASSSGSSKNYHPKAYSGKRASKQFNSDPGKHRKTFPCDKCDRVLLTYQGFIYHQLCHSNSKPYTCRTCPSAFRSKQACTEHEKAHG